MNANPAETPVVAVVIPACGATCFLEDAVKSALSQTLRELAVTVVDDSPPGDPPVLIGITDPRLTLQRRRLNGGPGASRNDGWRSHSNAKYVAFLDADDLWDDSKLRKQVEYLEAHGDCVALGCLMRYISSDGAVLGVAGGRIGANDHARIASGDLFPFQLSSVVVRRDALVRVNGFDEDLGRVGSEDLDLLARLAECGRIATLSVTLGSYRIHPDSAMARHRARINRAARFVRQRIQARRAGSDLTWETFLATDEPSWGERRQDAVERCYRNAALWYAEHRSLRAVGYGLLALAINPCYTLRRIYQQRGCFGLRPLG